MQTLFTSDRMIVKGEEKTYLVSDLVPAPSIEESEKVYWDSVSSIELEFIFKVNGKLSQFHYSFVLEEDEMHEISLKNWYEWYPVAELFFVMWYNFGENSLYQNPMIMRKWINTCHLTKVF